MSTTMNSPIINSDLEKNHLIARSFPIRPEIVTALHAENWPLLDQHFLELTQPNGELFLFLKKYLNFNSIEHIIAIRQSPDDEDGIWHDDGSRLLGFSLSLTQDFTSVQGGELCFRKKAREGHCSNITTRPMGTILLFKTGIYGFEHMVTAVTKGKRIVIAGWCS